ncbi:MAG TPA: hypothetical protein PLM33_03255, partial [Acidobacteriota bacterium]|nr:hypothetical protein [Acidobacteriota bacterium]
MSRSLLPISLLLIGAAGCSTSDDPARIVENFGGNWLFHLGDIEDGQDPQLADGEWRLLDLPHDWSIEGD